MKTVFILTYSPDPRLIKRLRSFLKYGFEVELIFAERTHAIDPFIGKNLSGSYKLDYHDSGKLTERLSDLIGFITKANRIIKRIKPQLIYTSGFDGLLAAFLSGWYKKAFLIYEVSDMPGGRWYEKDICRKLIDILEKMATKHVDTLILTSPHFKEKGRYDEHKSKIMILENLPEKRLFANYRKREHESFTVGNFGLVRHKRSLDTLVRALGNVEGVKVHIAGRAMGIAYEDIVGLCANYDNIEFTDSYDYENDIVNLYSSIDCVYSVYDRDDKNMNLALGNRLYEAIVCGLPLLVTKGSKMGDFVESRGIGFAVQADDPVSVKQAVLRMVKDKKLVDEIEQKCESLQSNCFYEAAEEQFMNHVSAMLEEGVKSK